MTKRRTFIQIFMLILLTGQAQLVIGSEQIRATVERILLAQARQDWPDATIKVTVSIDPRLRLSTCEDLEVLLRGQQQVGRVHVAVRCGKPQSWSVYLPADIEVSARVLVAARPLVRGQQLNADDIAEALMPLTGRAMQLVSRDSIRGLSPKRPIAKGALLTLPLFSRTPAIARNDVVRLLSEIGSIRIETKGKAIDGGQVGEQVMVENLTSGRRVAAWVVGPGIVSTRPQESL